MLTATVTQARTLEGQLEASFGRHPAAAIPLNQPGPAASSAPGCWPSSATTRPATPTPRRPRTTPARHRSPRPRAPATPCSPGLPATSGCATRCTCRPCGADQLTGRPRLLRRTPGPRGRPQPGPPSGEQSARRHPARLRLLTTRPSLRRNHGLAPLPTPRRSCRLTLPAVVCLLGRWSAPTWAARVSKPAPWARWTGLLARRYRCATVRDWCRPRRVDRCSRRRTAPDPTQTVAAIIGRRRQHWPCSKGDHATATCMRFREPHDGRPAGDLSTVRHAWPARRHCRSCSAVPPTCRCCLLMAPVRSVLCPSARTMTLAGSGDCAPGASECPAQPPVPQITVGSRTPGVSRQLPLSPGESASRGPEPCLPPPPPGCRPTGAVERFLPPPLRAAPEVGGRQWSCHVCCWRCRPS